MLPTALSSLVGNHFFPLSSTKVPKLYLVRTTFVKQKSMIFYAEITKNGKV